MLNQIILIGRIVEEIGEKEGNYSITMAIPRSFKNKDGEYENDFIEIISTKGIGESTKEYCKKGDLIGIKGRVETGNIIKAEKITFLSNSAKKED